MERVVIAIATAASMIGGGVVIVAQGVLDPQAVTWERIVGGSVLMLAAIFIARYSLLYIKEISTNAREDREAWASDRQALVTQLQTAHALLAEEREAWTAERRDILGQLDKSQILLTELSAQLEREQELRQSLERYGLSDRRERLESEQRLES